MSRAARLIRCGLLSSPHRILFLFAALSAACAPTVWLIPNIDFQSAAKFHSAQLIYGMVWAAIGGYVLTAISSWNPNYRHSPWVSIISSALWLSDRIISLILILRQSYELANAEAFPLFLVVFIALNLGRNAKSTAWLVLFIIFWINAFQLLAALELIAVDASMTASIVLLIICALISAVGGRAIPAFAAFWDPDGRSGNWNVLDRTLEGPALTTIVVGIVFIYLGWDTLAGLSLATTGLLLFVRTYSWSWQYALFYPALMMLFLAWIWLPFGMTLVGVMISISGNVTVTTQLHAIAMGSIGSMTFAIMARPAMKRKDGRLIIGAGFAAGFTILQASVILRVGIANFNSEFNNAIFSSSIMWITAWIFFLISYLQSLFAPPFKPVFSASHRDRSSHPHNR